jgi:hypothetical protein
MSTNAIIGLVVAIVVIGGGAWYVSSHPSASTEGATGAQTTGGEQNGTFGTLLALGGSQTCHVNITNPQAPSTGTVYVSNGEVRSDVETTVNGKTVTAHVIKTSDTLYTWTDMAPQGVKLSLSAATSANSSGSSSGFDANAQVQYSCVPWVADSSKFTVPANVSFMDMTSIKAGAIPQGGTMPTPPPGYPNTY